MSLLLLFQQGGGAAADVSVSSWNSSWTDPSRSRVAYATAVALIASGAVIGAGALTQSDAIGWHQPFSGPVRTKTPPQLATALITSGAVISPWALTQAEAVTVDRWLAGLSEPVRSRAGLAVQHQQALAYIGAAPFSERVSVDRWQSGLSEPVRSRAGLPAYQQQALTLAESAPFPETVSIDRWLRGLDTPTRRRGFQEGWFSLAPFPITAETVTVDKWYAWFGEPVRTRPSLFVGEQQSLAFVQAAPFAEATTVDRWFSAFSLPTLRGGLSVTLQVAFTTSLVFDEPPPPPVLTAPPGHGDYPRFPGKKPRPIWDRRPDAVDPIQDAGPEAGSEPAPVAEAKKADLKSGDYESLVRLIAPEMPQPAAPAKPSKKKTKAQTVIIAPALVTAVLAEGADTVAAVGTVETLADGSVVDCDTALGYATIDIEGAALLHDTDQVLSRGNNPIVGRASIIEDADTLTAVAAWDDDDLALSLLLED